MATDIMILYVQTDNAIDKEANLVPLDVEVEKYNQCRYFTTIILLKEMTTIETLVERD